MARRILAVWVPDWSCGHDPQTVSEALGLLAPGWAAWSPGWWAIDAYGPSRYVGGDEALAQRVVDQVRHVGPLEQGPELTVRVGLAEGLFAAAHAARSARPGPWPGSAVHLVPAGETGAFLATLPVDAVLTVVEDAADLVGVLHRLGVHSLGQLAELPLGKVQGRFGARGRLAHRLACGDDDRLLSPERPVPDLEVAVELDPPEGRIEAAAFVARGLADELGQRLAVEGCICTRLRVGLESEHGERHERTWRIEGFAPSSVADRVRWQLKGWVEEGAGGPSGGLSRMWLSAEEVASSGGYQLDWVDGGALVGEARDRAVRGLARLQALVGPERVLMARPAGGRGPAEQVRLVPADDVAGDARVSGARPGAGPGAGPGGGSAAWPGRVPSPSPARVWPVPQAVEVVDGYGREVWVTGRGELSAAPVRVAGREVVAFSSPWAYDERWWDRARHRRRARLQVVLADGVAHLLMVERSRWYVEATYD